MCCLSVAASECLCAAAGERHGSTAEDGSEDQQQHRSPCHRQAIGVHQPYAWMHALDTAVRIKSLALRELWGQAAASAPALFCEEVNR